MIKRQSQAVNSDCIPLTLIDILSQQQVSHILYKIPQKYGENNRQA